jgi:hypothetical protein
MIYCQQVCSQGAGALKRFRNRYHGLCAAWGCCDIGDVGGLVELGDGSRSGSLEAQPRELAIRRCEDPTGR